MVYQAVISAVEGDRCRVVMGGRVSAPLPRMRVLKEEREQLPAAMNLDRALEMLAQAQGELSEAEARKERRLDQERSAKQAGARTDIGVRKAELVYGNTVASCLLLPIADTYV